MSTRVPWPIVTIVLGAMAGCGAGEETPDAARMRDGGPGDATATDVAALDARLDAMPADVTADTAPRDVAATDAPTDPFEAARQACVDRINMYRATVGLGPYMRWREGEACADRMAANDARVGVPHDGFNRSICSPRGNGQNECPNGIGTPAGLPGCLAQMWAEGPTPDGSWDIPHGHYMNMIGQYTYMGFMVRFTRVACGFSSAGWAAQNFE